MGKGAYNTRQAQAVLACLESDGRHMTAAQVAQRLDRRGTPMGLATVYRHLDKLVKGGRVHKHYHDDGAGACYTYILEGEPEEEAGLQLACTQCGRQVCLPCGFLQELTGHVSREHQFDIAPDRSVLYGTCQHCARKGEAP